MPGKNIGRLFLAVLCSAVWSFPSGYAEEVPAFGKDSSTPEKAGHDPQPEAVHHRAFRLVMAG